MLTSELFKKSAPELEFPADREIFDIQLDSRKVKPGSLFMAMKGSVTDGSQYIPEALDSGASLVITDNPKSSDGDKVIFIKDLRSHVPYILRTFYGEIFRDLQCIGVTGTNGKTTVAKLISSLLIQSGHKVISLGTIENNIGDEIYPSKLTTPDPVELMYLINRGVKKGCTALVMEASSHALKQDRVAGVPFSRALFTNLTQDHLDYHEDFEDYFQTKKLLFTKFLNENGSAAINIDDKYGRRLADELDCEMYTFSQKNHEDADPGAGVTLEKLELSLNHTMLDVMYMDKIHTFRSSLFGKINVENLMSAVTLGFSLELSDEVINNSIGNISVPGRNEAVRLPNGAMALIDYAHTPDALERIITSVRPLVKGKIITVFGCGGDRDKSKRSMMGQISGTCSDLTVVTSDNPRTEDPADIISDIMTGISGSKKVVAIPDRAHAIEYCLDKLRDGDCGIIAGKGHEDYQIIGTEVKHFSDKEQVTDWIRSK